MNYIIPQFGLFSTIVTCDYNELIGSRRKGKPAEIRGRKAKGAKVT